MSFHVPTRQYAIAITVTPSKTTANGSGRACGASLNSETASTPITAGPMSRIAARAHPTVRMRSNTGSGTSISTKEQQRDFRPHGDRDDEGGGCERPLEPVLHSQLVSR